MSESGNSKNVTINTFGKVVEKADFSKQEISHALGFFILEQHNFNVEKSIDYLARLRNEYYVASRKGEKT